LNGCKFCGKRRLESHTVLRGVNYFLSVLSISSHVGEILIGDNFDCYVIADKFDCYVIADKFDYYVIADKFDCYVIADKSKLINNLV
jgi:hypothetical protein